MSIKKTDFLKFGEELYEVVPPAPSEEDRGGVIASPATEADTIEAKLGDDGKLYVAADTAGSAAAALALAEQNTQTKIDELSSSVDGKLAGKAATNHMHASTKITYDGVSGNYIDSGSTLTSVLEVFDTELYGKVSDVNLINHTSNDNIHVTQADKDAWNSKADASALAGKADVTHGHDASEIAFDSSTKEITGDTVLEALENADLAISNKAEKVHSHVASNITDLQTKLDSTLESSKGYTDEKVALLLNNSSEAVDSIMELATAMQENEDVVNALEQAVGNKADASALTSHTGNTTVHVTQAEKNTWNAKADASALANKADKTHDHNDVYYTETEVDTMFEDVVYIDAEDNEDIADTECGSNIVVDSALSSTSTNPVQNKVVTEKFGQLEEQIADQLGETIPDYWKEFIDGKESVIKEKLDEGGVDAFPILWGADIHGSKGASNTNGAGTSVTKNIGLIAKYTLDKYKAPYAMFSGDIHSQASHTSVESVEAEYEAVNAILFVIDKDKLLVEKGNHDGAWGAPVDGVYYLKNIGGKKIYNRLFRRQSLDRNRVFGGDGSYFYVDSPQKVRIIMLNGHTDGDGSVDADGNAVYNSMKNGVYGTEQLKWLCDVALNVSEGTRIIVSAHQPFSSSKDGELLAGILEAYNKRISYNGTKNVQNDYWGKDVTDTTYTNVSVNADFSEAKGKVVIYLHGHIHKDTIDTATYSFAVASITTAGADVRDTDPPLRTPNTATETALDFVIMSKTAINFIRIGAGSDRVIALDDTVYYSIKNNLTNVKNSNSAGNIVAGNSYSATISANTGYELESVVVTMGGVDVTNEVYADGVITISEVTGNVVITASATKIETDEPTTGYTNQILISTDADGNVVGELVGYRYNSSDVLKENVGTNATGFIPSIFGDTIRFENIIFNKSLANSSAIYLRAYKSDGTLLLESTPDNLINLTDARWGDCEYDEDGNIISIVLNNSSYVKDIAKIRMAYVPTDKQAIITVNEPITDGGFTPTTIPITWKSGYNCNYDVGSACTESENSSYVISENIAVEEGDTFTITREDGTDILTSSQVRIIELDSENIILNVISIDHTTVAESYEFTVSEGVTQIKFRTYDSILTQTQDWIVTKIGGSSDTPSNIIDTVGYEDDKRISASDGTTLKDATGYVVTGMITVPSGKILKTNGVNFTNASYANAMIFRYNYDTEAFIASYKDSSYEVAGAYTVTNDGNGNLTLVATADIKLRLVGYGSGANLVVTIE